MSLLVSLCLAVLIVQVVSLLMLVAVFAFLTQRGEREVVPVSIIVCARNEEPNLRILLSLLVKQSHPEFEIIVAIDRSTDGSVTYVGGMAGRHPQLRYIDIGDVPAGSNGKKYALMRAIEVARHDVVLLTDADCRPGPKWATEMASAFDGGCRIVLGYSPYLKTSGLLNTFVRFETLLTGVLYIGMARMGAPYMGVGRNLAYRRSFFLEGNGFSGIMNVTGGDDDLWVNRNAQGSTTRIRVGADSLVWSVPKTTWRAFFDQKLRHLSVGTRYRPWHQAILGAFNLSYILSWILPIACILLLAPSQLLLQLFFVRLILLTTLVVVASVRLGDKFDPWPVLLLDFLYVFYYISTSLRALFTRKVQWTN